MKQDLFNTSDDGAQNRSQTDGQRPHNNAQSPLADRMRPAHLDEVVGQQDLLGPRGPLRLLLSRDTLPSLLLWGPPGCGKTTLARLVARHTNARFLEYSAVAVGSRELKTVMAEAEKLKHATSQRTILFLDEIHRFNKAQQDALLPWVERGDVTLIGATTENPSFEVNSALLSRMRLFVLRPLSPEHVQTLLQRALTDDRGLGSETIQISDEALAQLAEMSEGDARAALGLLETVAFAVTAEASQNEDQTEPEPLTPNRMAEIIQKRAARYDKDGEEHYNIISALHKSLRNSDVQAALYWLARMLEAGEDPLYIARRLVRFASEDIGLADPEALRQTLAARDAVQFIGLPEGSLALAQAVTYLALSPKSNALYTAYKQVAKEVGRGHNPSVPLHLRNAPTKMMKGLGYGEGYIYAPDTAAGIGAMSCLPESLQGRVFYQPGRRGFEMELAERMNKIAAWHERRRAKSDTQTETNETPGGKE